MTNEEIILLRNFITWQSLPFVDNLFNSEDETIKHFNKWLIQINGNQQPMRDATEEERKSVKDYIESISKPTGMRFDAQLTDLTAEEKEIIDAIHKMGLFRTNYANDKVSKAVSKIIKAYDAQPCEDCISRTKLIQKLNAWDSKAHGIPNYAWKVIKEMPSVIPERPKGKWIPAPMIVYGYPLNCTCSKCGKKVINTDAFCPRCGSYNRGEEDDKRNND